MRKYSPQPKDFPEEILNIHHIQLLEKFKKFNSQGKNLYCSYMSIGQKYDKELLVIGREPSYWPEKFSIDELIKRGEVDIFKNKVYHHATSGRYSLCPPQYVTDKSCHDPFWGCTKEIVRELGISKNETNWSSHIALSYLYKIAYSSSTYLPEKPRIMQFEHCKEIFQIELSILRPKRILFLSGMKYAQDFLELSDCSGLEDCVCPLGEFDYGFHKAQTVVSVHPKKYKREKLVKKIIKGFK